MSETQQVVVTWSRHYPQMGIGIYCRLSPRPDGDYQAGLARQEEDCRRLAALRRWEVAEVYIDQEASAYLPKVVRPRFEALLEDLSRGVIDGIVCYDLDRLARQPMDLERAVRIYTSQPGLCFATVQGDLDLSSGDGLTMARVMVAFANKSSMDTSRRVRRKHQELAEAGRAVGGGRPFGYEPDRLTVREPEAALIREAAARVLAGESIRAISLDWQARGIPTVRGSEQWKPQVVKRILTSWRIAGLRAYYGGALVDRYSVTRPTATAEWPPILDEWTLRRVRAVLLDPARRTGGSGWARAHWLTGFIFCGQCGARLQVAEMRRLKKYRCVEPPRQTGCGGVSISAGPTEDLVLASLQRKLDQDALRRSLKAPTESTREQALLSAIHEDEGQLEQLARDHYSDRLISRLEYSAAREALGARLLADRKALAQVVKAEGVQQWAGSGSDLAERWTGLTLDQRRAVLAAAVETITVTKARHRGGRYDPSRVAITWRV